MRATRAGLIFLAAAAAAMAQRPAQQNQPPKTFSSAADIQAMIEKAKAEHKPNQALISQRILHLQPYNVNLEYRASVGPAAVHEREAEIFYVIDGSATLTTGGKLTNERRTNAANLTGSGIEGGTSRMVSKGDFIVVPENTPHWFSKIDGTVVLMTLHVPRPVPGAR
ncbi:MAG TPA: cupin domain-containing protein [Bryobacteraceae bacterium]|nr:cupin domain-containing protein [Bryobacteraceae bacterium]